MRPQSRRQNAAFESLQSEDAYCKKDKSKQEHRETAGPMLAAPLANPQQWLAGVRFQRISPAPVWERGLQHFGCTYCAFSSSYTARKAALGAKLSVTKPQYGPLSLYV